MLKNILFVGVGGMLGSIVRYAITLLIKHASLPVPTFVVNVVGCLVIGIVMGLAHRGSINSDIRLLLATGVCGGFTTFSSFSWENINLLTQHRTGTFGLYVCASLLFGFLATLVGYVLAK